MTIKKTRVRINKPKAPVKPDPTAPVEWCWGMARYDISSSGRLLEEIDFNLAKNMAILMSAKGLNVQVYGGASDWWLDISTYGTYAPSLLATVLMDLEKLIRDTVPHISDTIKIACTVEFNFYIEAKMPKTLEMVAAENRVYEKAVMKYDKALAEYNSKESIEARAVKGSVKEDKIKALEKELAKLKKAS